MEIGVKKILCILLMIFALNGCAAMNWWGGWGNSVTVRKGDTLYSISRKYNVPIKDMIQANRLSAPYTLYVGQKLNLPSKQYHTVQRGESLYSIARMHNVDVTSLSRVNTASAVAKAPSSQNSATKYQSAAKSQTETYTPPASNRKTKFMWPVNGTVISGFGNLGKGRKNDGINIKVPLGTAVKAADGGTVAYAGNELKGFGNLILIKHTDGWITAYAHNDKLLVKKGQKVVRGEKIATVGSTGSVTVPQLHFEVRAGKKAVNPRSYLP